MALTPNTGDAFVREVDDEYRRERVAKLWSRYGRLLLVAIGLGLVAIGGLLFWQDRQRDKADEQGAELLKAQAALARGEAPAAATLDQLEASSAPGYRALAGLTRANAAIRGGDRDEGIKRYDAIAADASLPDPFRDLARLRSVQLQFDTLPPATAIERLRPLAQPGGPWFGTAGELSAVAYLNSGKRDLALPLLEALLTDPQVPPTIQRRALQLLGGLDPARLDNLMQRRQAEAAARGGAAGAAAAGTAPAPTAAAGGAR